MCFKATCPTCSKASWRGCGSHIPQALANVPQSEWCSCPPRVTVNGRQYPAAAAMAFPGYSWITGWFGGGNKPRKEKGDL
ncbi:hypothetical protein NLU13_6938 [Sarocladium strictum]|uniref:Uncharacterized protein n=1 Tax=Sarocladium strictum TaxID=5046 RepID=A0AA39GEM1_SARSR|nr:hypothetical protein NLU13_6938 [Sarocladium strictum]